jgi:hypothetical protein
MDDRWIKVRSTAVMAEHMEWKGFIPEDVPESERWVWIKDNVCGSHFTPVENGGDWEWESEVQVISKKTFTEDEAFEIDKDGDIVMRGVNND